MKVEDIYKKTLRLYTEVSQAPYRKSEVDTFSLRAKGWTFERIGKELDGITRQAAQSKFRTFCAAAANDFPSLHVTLLQECAEKVANGRYVFQPRDEYENGIILLALNMPRHNKRIRDFGYENISFNMLAPTVAKQPLYVRRSAAGRVIEGALKFTVSRIGSKAGGVFKLEDIKDDYTFAKVHLFPYLTTLTKDNHIILSDHLFMQESYIGRVAARALTASTRIQLHHLYKAIETSSLHPRYVRDFSYSVFTEYLEWVTMKGGWLGIVGKISDKAAYLEKEDGDATCNVKLTQAERVIVDYLRSLVPVNGGKAAMVDIGKHCEGMGISSRASRITLMRSTLFIKVSENANIYMIAGEI